MKNVTVMYSDELPPELLDLMETIGAEITGSRATPNGALAVLMLVMAGVLAGEREDLVGAFIDGTPEALRGNVRCFRAMIAGHAVGHA